MELLIQTFRDPDESATVLFCIPHAGVGSSAFRGWAEALQPDIQVVLVQFPGRENRYRENPFRELRGAAGHLLSAVTPYLNRRFAFFGNSLGALIAYEAIHELAACYQKRPAHFFVSACRPPHVPPSLPGIHRLPDQEFITELVKRYDAIHQVILQDSEFMKAVLPTLRADLEMYETYVYRERPPLACPISAFGGRHDAMVPSTSLGDWRRHTSHGFDLTLVDAGHIYLQTERPLLTKAIRAALAN